MASVKTLIERAIDQFGTETNLARAAGVAQPSINQAKHTGKIGHRLAAAIDRATGGKISKHELRPDIWPSEDDAA